MFFLSLGPFFPASGAILRAFNRTFRLFKLIARSIRLILRSFTLIQQNSGKVQPALTGKDNFNPRLYGNRPRTRRLLADCHHAISSCFPPRSQWLAASPSHQSHHADRRHVGNSGAARSPASFQPAAAWSGGREAFPATLRVRPLAGRATFQSRFRFQRCLLRKPNGHSGWRQDRAVQWCYGDNRPGLPITHGFPLPRSRYRASCA